MCFSAEGSFAVAGVLTAVGAASLARNDSPPHRMFAAIPLGFAAQQAAEGILWLTIDTGTHAALQRVAVDAFLAFALILWPSWLPWSLRRIERDPVRRRRLTLLSAFGVLVSTYATWFLTQGETVARIAGHSIRYDYAGMDDGRSHLPYLLAYLVPTVVPLFVSTVSLARALGVTLAASLLVTSLAWRGALTSVWCFFASILSGIILVAGGRERRALAADAAAPAPMPLPTRP